MSKRKMKSNPQDIKNLGLELFNEIELSFLKKKTKVNFFNELIVYCQDNKCFFYNTKEKKVEHTVPLECKFPCQINKEKIALIMDSCLCILDYGSKRLSYAYNADFNYVFHAICIKEKTLVILGGGSVYIYDIDTKKGVGIRYPHFMELTADSRSLVPINDELLLIMMRSIDKGPYCYLLNWKTKQIVTIIYKPMSYINCISGKIEKGFVDKKKISRITARLLPEVNIQDIFTFNTKVNQYLDSLKLLFIFNIVDNKLIGCLEKGNYDLIIRVIDIQNFQILQIIKLEFSGMIYDFISNGRFFIFQGLKSICYELNYTNIEKYLQKNS